MTPLEEKQEEIRSIQMGNLAKPWIDDDRLAHGIDRDGKPFEYDIAELFWDLEKFNYFKTQTEYFNLCLDAFPDELSGKYIVFETGKVIDTDSNRQILIDRVIESGFLKQKHRPIVFVAYVANKLERQTLSIEILPKLESDRLMHLFSEFKQLSKQEQDHLFANICNERICDRQESIANTEKLAADVTWYNNVMSKDSLNHE